MILLLLAFGCGSAALSWYQHRSANDASQQTDAILQQHLPTLTQLQQLGQLQQQLTLAVIHASKQTSFTPLRQQLQQQLRHYYQHAGSQRLPARIHEPLRRLLFSQSQLLDLAEQQRRSNNPSIATEISALIASNTAALTQLNARFNLELNEQLGQQRQAMRTNHQRSLWLALLLSGTSLVTAIGLYRGSTEYQQRLRLASFAEQSPLPILRCSSDGVIRYANPATKALINNTDGVHSEAELLPDLSGRIQTLGRLGHTQAQWQQQIGTDHYSVNATLLLGAELVQIHLLNDSGAHQAQQELAHRSNFDALTGLPNRQQLLQECDYWSQQPGCCFSFGTINLQQFERVSNQLSFASADEIMQQFSRRLSLALHQLNLAEAKLYRFEGTHYGVLLVHQCQKESLQLVAQQLLQSCQRPLTTSDQLHTFHLTINQGYAAYPTQAKTVAELLAFADIAAREALHCDQQSLLFEPQMHQRQQQFAQLENELRGAEQRGELTLMYQPQLQLQRQQIYGTEALIRWRHPERGLISPAEFIPVAEQSGLIIPIGDWVLRTACAQARQWHQQGLPVRMSINLSAKQFQQPHFVDKVAAILTQTQVDPSLIELELTESLLMEDIATTNELLRQLKQLGVQLAIDDFGTGYSSLAYLKRFPVDTLKVDRCFVANLPDDAQDSAIVSSVLDLAAHLQLTVVAEGVETDEQRHWLQQHQCHVMQGFWFSRPLAAEACQQLLQQSFQAKTTTKTSETKRPQPASKPLPQA
ncbi:GGDEF domain-containing phosphodiesterase [uncultured Ferrimonas sp.]|uniref:putative bifunctional diguanylate cyclase/phosphodiesterase n=1 Tax=uncultured Ferrimonas sp. TaxID=432640 RepID=UPI002603C85A|nr:GGDEF domain-containing phosphodiesterase [uncultured Ferrimonas sp.]